MVGSLCANRQGSDHSIGFCRGRPLLRTRNAASPAMDVLEFVRAHIAATSPMARFIAGLAVLFVVPPLCRRVKLPPVVGLLLAGAILGPHVLDVFGKDRPV